MAFVMREISKQVEISNANQRQVYSVVKIGFKRVTKDAAWGPMRDVITDHWTTAVQDGVAGDFNKLLNEDADRLDYVNVQNLDIAKLMEIIKFIMELLKIFTDNPQGLEALAK